MTNCTECTPKYVPGALRHPRKRPCPYQEPAYKGGPVPNHKPKACPAKPAHISLRTQILPPNLGTDEEGQPYAPAVGSFYDTVVVYLANGAIYLYDSNGVFTNVLPGDYDKMVEEVEGFKQALDELYNPATIYQTVETYDDLEQLNPADVPYDQMILVKQDETHEGKPSLYYYSPAARAFVYAYQASPYYTKEYIDELETSINARLEAEEQARTEADAAETEAREAADKALSDRIEEVVNSPDVRYIVDTYADLNELEKSGIGDLDYARVLQDETHDGASTYYQFHKDAQEWGYVGMTGPYYTKTEIDDKFDSLPKVELYSEYGENEDGALTQKFVSGKLNGGVVVIGSGAAAAQYRPESDHKIAIGMNAQASSNSNSDGVAIGANALASGTSSMAVGEGARATGWYSMAFGGSGTDGATGRYAITMGHLSKANSEHSIAIGYLAHANATNSIAIGYSSSTSRSYEVAIGRLSTGSLSSTDNRYLTGLRDGEKDWDAVTVHQLNAAVGDIETILAEINNGVGA